MAGELWTIVLAAGAGRRLAEVTGGVPKQFWRDAYGRTLLEDTLARVSPLCPPERTLVVVDRTHAPYVEDIDLMADYEHVLFQPRDRGTALGVLLALIDVVSRAPDALVLLTPADHAVLDPDRFQSGIRAAMAAIDARATNVVLFGAEPSAPSSDYGWIYPSRAVSPASRLRGVVDFFEKPAPEAARQLFASGAVWNTMVLVARAESLLDLYRRHLPVIAHTFIRTLTMDPESRRAFLRSRYAELPTKDFSQDLLTRSTDLSVYTWPTDLGWSDLGTPERLALAGRMGIRFGVHERTARSAMVH